MNTAEIAQAIPTLAEVEQEHILKVMQLLDGNKPAVARALGCCLKTLYLKLNRYAEQEGAIWNPSTSGRS